MVHSVALSQDSTPLSAEIRAIITSIEQVREELESMGAVLMGDYAFTDYIYQPHNTSCDLNKEFIRIRAYQKTNWNQKKFSVVHKRKEQEGMTGKILLRAECDTFAEAEQMLCDSCLFRFSFSRNGYEYSLNSMKLFVEDIQGLPPTIEVVAASKQQIDELFEKLSITVVIIDSVGRMVEKIRTKV
jgi:adenylate cyclase class IV